MFVDAVVVDPEMMMTTDVKYDPAFFGGSRKPLSQLPPIPMSADKVVAIPTGAVYVAPADVPHYIWAKDGNAEYQEAGEGLTATVMLKP